MTSLLVLYLYSERGWTAAHAALALGGVQVGAALARVLRRALVRPPRRARRAVPAAGDALPASLLLAGAVVGPPALMAGGVAAMSWNGLSFTAAAEISGRRQAGKAMGIQNTSMRVVGAGVPVGLGRAGKRRSRGRSCSWSWAWRRSIARVLLGPLVDDERRRGREREARLESRGHAGGTTSVDPVGP